MRVSATSALFCVCVCALGPLGVSESVLCCVYKSRAAY